MRVMAVEVNNSLSTSNLPTAGLSVEFITSMRGLIAGDFRPFRAVLRPLIA